LFDNGIGWEVSMRYISLNNISTISGAQWSVCYVTIDVDVREIVKRVRAINSKVDIFGCSSFNGVFTPDGFIRGVHFLASYEEDEVSSYSVITECSADNALERTESICKQMKDNFGVPDVILMHATPGFEERIIEGIEKVFDGDVRVYGGSAADDDISGKWFIFKNDVIVKEGVLLIGFKHRKKVYGAFLSGYLPTSHQGTVTKASGRIVYEIDGKPAALVYNEWTGGAISEYLDKGGVILSATTLSPIGRVISEVLGIKQYLLSHPHQVLPKEKAITFFSEFKEGDQIVLMKGYKSSLIDRVRQVVERALGVDKGRVKLSGAIFVYCGGCVGAILDDIGEVVEEYKINVGNTPFVGAATFGEQGCFVGQEKHNKHGNLMANMIMFQI
jgi:hypothetical protein